MASIATVEVPFGYAYLDRELEGYDPERDRQSKRNPPAAKPTFNLIDTFAARI